MRRREHRWRSYGPTRDRKPWFDGAGIAFGSMRPEYLAQAEAALSRVKSKDPETRRGIRRLLVPIQNERRYRTWARVGEGTNRRSR